MLDLGRPLHAYDADKISGDIFIRLAETGEKYLALDGKEYSFSEDMIVIGDNNGVDDLAGIMGGERSGCDDQTVNMFLEAAIFDPVRTASTGRKLNIISDARYRFERGLDPTSPGWGSEMATKMILEICGGEASEFVSSEIHIKKKQPILFDTKKIKITKLGQGLPIGGELENLDDGTLIPAFNNRTEIV